MSQSNMIHREKNNGSSATTERGISNDGAVAIAVDNSRNVFVTGYSGSSGTGDDYATIKYSASGDEQWVVRYNGPGNDNDKANAIAIDNAGNVFVTGNSKDSKKTDDYATIKYNALGEEQWVARYNGSSYYSSDEAKALAVDNIGNVYVTGTAEESGMNFNYVTIKYNALGEKQWVVSYNGSGNAEDVATALAVDNKGNVYVTGNSKGSGSGYDYATIKYNSSGLIQWIVRYNGLGNANDNAGILAIDNAGNVYVTGLSIGSGTSSDYATIKYNTSGIEQWVVRYQGLGNSKDCANVLTIDNTGNVYVAGYSKGPCTSYDYATIKYNSLGEEQWVARYNGPGNADDIVSALTVDNTGNVYVTGYSRGSGTKDDYATIKYNSLGEEQWVARFNGPENFSDIAYALAVDNTRNVYITGGSYNSGTGGDYATIKYNESGEEQWVVRYNGPGNSSDKATALTLDIAGNVYVSGISRGLGTNEDYATIKYSSSGDELWITRYNGPGNDKDEISDLAIDNLGNVYVTGYSYGSNNTSDYATIKYSPSGEELWVARYQGEGKWFDEAHALAIDNAGNIYVTGYSDGVGYISGSGTLSDYATIKYSPSGEEQWVARYNRPENSWDYAYALAIDDAGNVFVTGYSFKENWSIFTTIKYSQIGTMVDEHDYIVPNKFLLYHNYPNPFNANTMIQYWLIQPLNVDISIFNLQGQKVATLVHEHQNEGFQYIAWDGRDETGTPVASGVYLFQIEAGSLLQAKKMLLLR